MSLADLLITLIIWVLQNIIFPILPQNIPALSMDTFNDILGGTLKHNLIWGLAGLNQFIDLDLAFILINTIILAEIIFWGIKAGMFLWKSIRGSG
jgi:hypothetical protein